MRSVFGFRLAFVRHNVHYWGMAILWFATVCAQGLVQAGTQVDTTQQPKPDETEVIQDETFLIEEWPGLGDGSPKSPGFHGSDQSSTDDAINQRTAYKPPVQHEGVTASMLTEELKKLRQNLKEDIDEKLLPVKKDIEDMKHDVATLKSRLEKIEHSSPAANVAKPAQNMTAPVEHKCKQIGTHSPQPSNSEYGVKVTRVQKEHDGTWTLWLDQKLRPGWEVWVSTENCESQKLPVFHVLWRKVGSFAVPKTQTAWTLGKYEHADAVLIEDKAGQQICLADGTIVGKNQ